MGARTLKTNFAINVAGALIPLAVSLVTVPIYIRHIGDARYGVLSIVWVLLGYFGFLDLGLSRAAANALARLRDAPQEARARVLVTALVLNLGMGLLGSVALAVTGGYLLQHVLNVPGALKPEIASAFPWIVALFPLALVSGVGIGALESREEFLRANILQVVGTSLGQVVPVMLAVAVGPSLAVVVPAAAAARALTVLATLISVYWLEGPLQPKHFGRSEIGGLLRYGGWVSVSGTLSPMLMTMDQLIVGSVAGVSALAHYIVPMNLVLRSLILPGAVSRTLFPQFSRGSEQQGRVLAEQALLSLALSFGAIISPSLFLARHFLRFWLGPTFAPEMVVVSQLFLLGVWVAGLGWIPGAFANARAKPELQAKLQICEIVPVAISLYCATEIFGVIGAAVIWMLRSILETIAMLSIAGLWPNVRVCFLLSAIFTLLSSSMIISQLANFGIGGSIACAMVATSVFLLTWAWARGSFGPSKGAGDLMVQQLQ